MMKKTYKPSTLLSPLPPALVSCGNKDKHNILTIGWTGITCSEPAQTYISVRKERFSHHIISENGCFVINLPTKALLEAVDFCGVRSGKDVDKFAHLGLTPAVCKETGCVAIEQACASIECKVDRVIPLGSHDMFMATIVSVSVDDSILDESGKVALEKAGLVAYAHGNYFPLGESIGTFGFSIRKK